jgi:hypothetical protein
MVRSELFYHGCHVYAVALSVCLHPAVDAVAAAAPNQAAKDESPLAYYKSVLLSIGHSSPPAPSESREEDSVDITVGSSCKRKKRKKAHRQRQPQQKRRLLAAAADTSRGSGKKEQRVEHSCLLLAAVLDLV